MVRDNRQNFKEEYYRVYLENEYMKVYELFEKIDLTALNEWLEKNCSCHDTVWWIDTRHEEVEKRNIPFNGNGYIVRIEKRRVYTKFGIVYTCFNEDGTTSVRNVDKMYDFRAAAKEACRRICENDVDGFNEFCSTKDYTWQYISGIKTLQKLFGDYDCVILRNGDSRRKVITCFRIVEFDVDITVQ